MTQRTSERVLRAVFVIATWEFGGLESRLLDWLSEVDYSQTEALILSPKDVFSTRIAARGLGARYVSLPDYEIKALFGSESPSRLCNGSCWTSFFNWIRVLGRICPDRIILMDGTFFSLPLCCVAATCLVSRGDLYMTEHLAVVEKPPPRTSRTHFGLIPGLGIWWYRRVWPWHVRARLSKRVLAVSRTVKNNLVEFYGYPEEKLEVIYHGVDVSRFSPSLPNREKWRRTHAIPAKDIVIVSTARLNVQKGIDRLLEVFALLSSERENLWLVLVGDGPERLNVENFLGRCSSSSRIKLLGHVEDVSGVLQASDIYVLPSDNEGFATALLEAMATELVCVTTRTAGSDEIIEHQKNGFLVEISHSGVLTGLQEALNLSVAERSQMGSCARRAVLQKYQLRGAVASALKLLGLPNLPVGPTRS